MAMGRRSEHSREELVALIVEAGSTIIAEHGVAVISAREIARRIGYSVSTVLKTMGSAEAIVTAINTRTMGLWANSLEAALASQPADRIATLVSAYFDFAARNRNLWLAITDADLPVGHTIPEDQSIARGRLTGIVITEVAQTLGRTPPESVALTRSLILTVHGHCHQWLKGTADLMGMHDVRGDALERVRDSLAVAQQRDR